MARYNRLSKLDKALRDSDIWALRAEGRSVREIAEACDMSEQTIRASLIRVAEQYKVESAAEIIKMELDRLDIMLVHAISVLETRHIAYSNGRRMTEIDEEGNETAVEDTAPILKAIDTVLKIMDRRSRYLGLDAPSKSEQSINVHSSTETDLALTQLINAYKQNALSLTPEQLQQQAALPATPEHPTITLPADHFAEARTQTKEQA